MKKGLVLMAAVAFVGFSVQAKTIDRGLGNPKSVYIPKGSVQFGVSGGYNTFNAGNLNGSTGATFLGLVDKIQGNVSFANASAFVSGFISNNVSLGARFSYGYTSVNLDNAAILSQINLTNKHVDVMSLTGSIACRAYIPLFDSKWFALFAEGRLNGKMGYNKNYEQYEKGKAGTYADVYSVSLGLYPGISMFVTDNVALEISLPLVEGGMEWNKQLTDGSQESYMNRAFAQFQPGILGLNIGISFCF